MSLLHESRIRAPKVTLGRIVGSLLILSMAYNMASSLWIPFSSLTAPHLPFRCSCMGKIPPRIRSPAIRIRFPESFWRNWASTWDIRESATKAFGMFFGMERIRLVRISMSAPAFGHILIVRTWSNGLSSAIRLFGIRWHGGWGYGRSSSVGELFPRTFIPVFFSGTTGHRLGIRFGRQFEFAARKNRLKLNRRKDSVGGCACETLASSSLRRENQWRRVTADRKSAPPSKLKIKNILKWNYYGCHLDSRRLDVRIYFFPTKIRRISRCRLLFLKCRWAKL